MSLKDVLIDEMRDLYSAENQQVKALPKVIKKISDDQLKANMAEHLDQTKSQVLRLREVFGHLGKKPTGKHCSGMEGCIDELTEAINEDEEGALKDAGILGAALRTEHYEIAGYTAALAMAKALKETEVAKLLTEILREEQATAKGIQSSATSILKEAIAQETEDDEEEDDEESKDAEEQKSEKESEQDEREAAPELTKSGSGKGPAKKKKTSK